MSLYIYLSICLIMDKEAKKKLDDIFNKSSMELWSLIVDVMRHNTVSFCEAPWILEEIYKEENKWLETKKKNTTHHNENVSEQK